MKHTPIPWKYEKVRTSIGFAYKIGPPEKLENDNGHYSIACLYDDNTSLNPYPEGEIEADAQFIVTACNEYKALKEQNRILTEALRIIAIAHNMDYVSIIAREALAKARGEQDV